MRCFLIAWIAAAASAQVFEAGVQGGVSRLFGKDLGTTSVRSTERLSLTDGWRLGFRITMNSWAHFGHESGYVYTRTKLRLGGDETSEFGMAIHQGLYNFLAYATPEGKPVRPFAAGGVHFSNFVPPGASVTSGGGSTKVGLNYGGGVKIRITPMFAIRFDARQYWNGKPFDLPNQNGTLRQMELSAGFSFIM